MRHTRKSMRRSQVLVEACEARRLFDQTLWNMAVQGQLTQNWTNTGMITTNNNWSTVPSIEGYNGNGLTSSTGVDPRTVVAPGPGTLFVTANQTNPDLANAAGIGEFEITNPVVALAGSGTANAPFLIFYLNASGQSSIPMSFKLRDIETLDTGVQQVSVQYRLATTGNWTDMGALPSTGTNATVYTAAATGAGLSETNVAFTLPAACDNASTLQIRVITTNAVGSDQWVGVDDVVIGASAIQAPTFKLDASSYQVNEAAGTITVNVLRELNTTGTDTVNYATTDITATSGSDYTGVSGVLTFTPGQTSKPIVINIANDANAENAETFTFALSNPSAGGALGAPNASTVTIVDNDSIAPTGVLLNELSVNPPTSTDSPFEYIELRGTASSALLNTYVVQLTGNTAVLPGAAGVAYRVFDLGTATIGTNGLLVVKSTTGGFTIPAGTGVLTSTQLDLATAASGLRDDAQTWAVVYSPIPLLQATDYDPSESGSLTALPAGAVTLDSVGWGAWGGFGYTGTLYTAAIVNPGTSGTNTNPADATSAATRFRNDTTANSGSAWFGGVLSGTTNDSIIYGSTLASSNLPLGAIITPGAANFPNMTNGSLVLDVTGYTVNENAGTATVTVTRSGGTSGSVTVDYATSNGTATAGSDYTAASGTLTFGNGVTTQTFTVSITDDSLYEASETINVLLSNPTGGAELGTAATTITILDNDPLTVPSVNLNELDVDPVGTDNPYEYVELISSTTNTPMPNVYFVAVEGDGNTLLGKVSFVQNLSAYSTGSNKLAMIKSNSGGHTVMEAGTTIIPNTAMFSGSVLQGGSHSFMLIFSPDSAITLNQQLGDQGSNALVLPSGAVLLDSVGWLDGTNGTLTDQVYGGVNISFASPSATKIPGAATRFPGNSTSLSAAAWYGGQVPSGSSLAYDLASVTANFPTGGALTPGGANAPVADAIPPTVSSVTYDYNTSGAAPALTVTFSEPVQGITLSDLASSSFTITDRTTLAAIPAANFTLTPVSASVYKITFNGANGAPSDGDFKLTVNAANVQDLATNVMAANATQNYSFLQGDATNDRKVNTLDFNVLAANFGGSSKTFSQGDFSFNGTIDSTDFTIFVGQYGKTLPAVPPPAPTLGAISGPSGSPFATDSLRDDSSIGSILA